MITNVATAIVLLFSQQAGSSLEAAYSQDEWALEYPALIGGFVDEYKTCLRSGSYLIDASTGFEGQYRKDIPRCAELGVRMERDSNALLAKRDRTSQFGAAQVAAVFESMRKIHVERGASLDRASRSAIVAARAHTGADTAPDTICAQVVADARAERRALLAKQDERLRELHDKDELTDEERGEMQGMFRALEAASGKVHMELARCPSAHYVVADAADAAEPENEGL